MGKAHQWARAWTDDYFLLHIRTRLMTTRGISVNQLERSNTIWREATPIGEKQYKLERSNTSWRKQYKLEGLAKLRADCEEGLGNMDPGTPLKRVMGRHGS